MDKYYIKTEDWEKIYAFLKTRQDIRVKSAEKTRTFAEAVYFIMRTGAHWRELPHIMENGEASINASNHGHIKVCGNRFLNISLKNMMVNHL